MTTSSQINRMLSLVPYLMRNGETSVEELTKAFGVSSKQLRRDLEVLSWCGLPQLHYGDYIEIDLDAVDGEGVVRLGNADYLSRPLRFTADEAVALLLALRTLREVADPDQFATIDQAAAKLERMAGDRAEPVGRAEVRISAGDDQVRTAVHQGLREHRRLDITYDVAARAETTHRQVDPLRASTRDGYVYLDAWCHTAQGLRSFRMDRIARAQVLPVAAEQHHDVVLPDPTQDWFSDQGDGPTVTLDLQPAAHWVVEYYPSLSDEGDDAPGPDQVRRVSFPVGDPAWLRGLLLRLGDLVQVVEPAGAGDPAQREAQEAIEQYRALGLLDDKADRGM